MEFAIFVVIFVVISIIGAVKKQGQSGGQPSPRVQKLIERIQAQQGGNVPIQFQGQFTQPQGGPPPVPQYQPGPYQAPPQWQPPPAPPVYQPQFHQQRPPRADLDTRVRELMQGGNEVAAVRLVSDERDLDLLESQAYVRGLVAPPASQQPAEAEESRYVGSAAFADSLFNLDRDEETWASGWVDKPEPEDRSDMDELWQTVRNPPRPQ